MFVSVAQCACKTRKKGQLSMVQLGDKLDVERTVKMIVGDKRADAACYKLIS